MRKLVVLNNLTLDGVMQAPGRPDEDTRDGFTHGGWAVPYNDAVKGQAMGEGMSKGADLLFGRRTYEDFFDVWPKRTNNPFTPVLDSAQKYVASRTLKEPLPGRTPRCSQGDAADAVARLKQEPGTISLVMGSGVLADSLHAARPGGRVHPADPSARAGRRAAAVRRRRHVGTHAREERADDHGRDHRDVPSSRPHAIAPHETSEDAPDAMKQYLSASISPTVRRRRPRCSGR